VNTVAITQDTTFYAVWRKDAFIDITSVADATLKTWQGEKNSNYGTASNLLMRAPGNTGTNGQFGQLFTSTSTTDGTDIKTALVRFDISQHKNLPVNSIQLRMAYQGYENGTAASNITFSTARANWITAENSVTWVNWNKTVYTGTGLVAAASQIASSSANGTQVNFDVTNLFNEVPADDNTISFALSVNNTAADYRLYSKEGAGTNPALRPTLRFNLTPEPDYAVTYDLNGVNGKAPIQPTLEAGMTFAAAPVLSPLLKEWNTKTDGSGTSYKPGDTVAMPAENLTLYAIWIDAQSLVAAYNDKGALISVSQYVPDVKGYPSDDVVNGLISAGAASIRAFIWDFNFIPLTDEMVIYKK
jgi:hypothetical protein